METINDTFIICIDEPLFSDYVEELEDAIVDFLTSKKLSGCLYSKITGNTLYIPGKEE